MVTEEQYLKAKKLALDFSKFIENLDAKLYKDNYYDVNFYKLPYKTIDMSSRTLTKENIDTLNYYINELNNDELFKPLRRTKSGGICVEKDFLHSNPFQFDVISSTSKHIITVVSPEVSFKVYVGFVSEKKNNSKKDGRTPSRRLIKACEDAGIDISKYANSKDDGAVAAKMIHKPDVRTVEAEIDKIYVGNIHHIDFHKFYPSGIVLLHPEFRKPFEVLRKKKDKEALDIGTRYLASKFASYQYAVLVKDGINFMYQRFYEVEDALKKSGRTILANNTDGIWYQGEIYHGKYEGADFGEWENDYIDVKQIRFASTGLGKYEFITKEGVYVPRFKGQSTFEREKSRMEWEWGDIYKGSAVKIVYNYKDNKFVIDGAY